MLDILSTEERVLLVAALSNTWLGLLAALEPAEATVCRKLISRVINAKTVVLNREDNPIVEQ